MQRRSAVRTRLVLKPGQRGTRQLVAQYGEQLLCVRYRYDEVAGKRYKTIELIIDTADWTPRQAPPAEVEPEPTAPQVASSSIPPASNAKQASAAAQASTTKPSKTAEHRPAAKTTIRPPHPVPFLDTDEYVYVQVLLDELELTRSLRQAGGIWNERKQVWLIHYKHVRALGLENRIVKNI